MVDCENTIAKCCIEEFAFRFVGERCFSRVESELLRRKCRDTWWKLDRDWIGWSVKFSAIIRFMIVHWDFGNAAFGIRIRYTLVFSYFQRLCLKVIGNVQDKLNVYKTWYFLVFRYCKYLKSIQNLWYFNKSLEIIEHR